MHEWKNEHFFRLEKRICIPWFATGIRFGEKTTIFETQCLPSLKYTCITEPKLLFGINSNVSWTFVLGTDAYGFPAKKNTVALTANESFGMAALLFLFSASATRSILFIAMDGDAVSPTNIPTCDGTRHMAYCRQMKQMLRTIFGDVKHNKILLFSKHSIWANNHLPDSRLAKMVLNLNVSIRFHLN